MTDFVLVPVEPTEAMIEAAKQVSVAATTHGWITHTTNLSGWEVHEVWSAMLAAAPRAPDDAAERVLAVIIAAHNRHHRSVLVEPAEWLVEAARDVAAQQIAENANCLPDEEDSAEVRGGDMTLVPNWLIAFLRGEDHWPGHPEVSFGDSHPTERAAFFWRRHMACVPIGVTPPDQVGAKES